MSANETNDHDPDREADMHRYGFRHDVMRDAEGQPVNVYTRPTPAGDLIRDIMADVVREAGGNPDPPANDNDPPA